MKNDVRPKIYKGMIQHILNTTDFSIKAIAILARTSIDEIQSIYSDKQIQFGFSKEINLIRLFELIVEMQHQKNRAPSFVQEVGFEDLDY
ncbi:hypothetical protein [Legionella pneumophila]|uniref:hypothetical protein n=1 Tax=Legionella pneumophila TaxID=446 RepID=UPI000770852D|nr:hypothetical protein [Legionella pneumophila]RYW81517.1 hypothetical protein D7216_13645 [Legionella pneumophila]CZG59434.1 Uncharacterised protein [Legionella pneumophila]SFZ43607.1 Uncharacterised protein [Legionella pneumophila]HAT1996040.1 hypothetical protein [Legionella pneumophila]HAT2003113.1 hypothetical protein [Legionella pneumophila]